MTKVYVPSSGPQSWRALLAEPENQWKTGFSAKTIAHCWEMANGLPPEIAAIFGGDAELLLAIPEHKVALGDGYRESQNDVFALVKVSNRTIALAVEGKVNETFGETIGEWNAEPSRAKKQRLAFLCDLLGIACPPPRGIRYQLLHRASSAVLESRRFKTDEAAMIVHSFSSEAKGFDAYSEFLEILGLSARPGEMAERRLANGQILRLGWVEGDARFLSA